MIKKFEDFEGFEDKELTREEKIQFILDNDENPNNPSADHDDLSALKDNQLDKFYNNVLISTKGVNESDGSTTAVVGSGTAVGGGASGSYTSAMGSAVSGYDSGSSFSTGSGTSSATLANTSGMGPIVSAQPSSKPGDVAGSKKGSGDIGSNGGMYTKGKAGRTMKNKKNAKTKRTKAINKIENLYTTNYKESSNNGRIIQSWKTFNEEFFYMGGENDITIEEMRDKVLQYLNSQDDGSSYSRKEIDKWEDDDVIEEYNRIYKNK